jgi:hypothetical protein
MSFRSYEPPVEDVEDDTLDPWDDEEYDETGERLDAEPLFVTLITCRECGGGIWHRDGCPETFDVDDEVAA